MSTASEDTLYALLRASDILGCDNIYTSATNRVTNLWPSHCPPDRPSNTEVCGIRPPESAVQAIVHARKYAIRGVLKRAFYELLRNPAFWKAVAHEHTHSGVRRSILERAKEESLLAMLSDTDIIRLQHARWEMREAFDALLRIPPGSIKDWRDRTCPMCPGPTQHQQSVNPSRNDAWAIELSRAPEFTRSTEHDEITRTHFIEMWLEVLMRGEGQYKWCKRCLDERVYTWREARTTWWAKLDGWLKTGEGVSVAEVNRDKGTFWSRR